MKIIICPGIHDVELTKGFVAALLNENKQENNIDILTFPGKGIFTLSKVHILSFLCDRLSNKIEFPVIFISFSAGVVGAIGAAVAWQMLGGNVQAFIAIDGWGVPLWSNFPIHRLSHDVFTHHTSAILGIGENNFYAEPPVDHLMMWNCPQNVKGYWVNSSLKSTLSCNYLTAVEFISMLLKHYESQ